MRSFSGSYHTVLRPLNLSFSSTDASSVFSSMVLISMSISISLPLRFFPACSIPSISSSLGLLVRNGEGIPVTSSTPRSGPVNMDEPSGWTISSACCAIPSYLFIWGRFRVKVASESYVSSVDVVGEAEDEDEGGRAWYGSHWRVWGR